MARTVTASDRALVTLDEAILSISANDTVTTDDQLKDNIQRLINYVSELFEMKTGRFLRKKNITEYWNGGFSCTFTKYAPVWAYLDDSDKVLLHDNEYDFESGDIEFTVIDTDIDTALTTDDYVINPDTGEVLFDYILAYDKRLWKVQYTTGFWKDETEVSEKWKEAALTAIRHLYSKDVTVWGGDDTQPNYPKMLPHIVEKFLNGQKAYKS